MSSPGPKRALYAQFAVVAKAMAHEHRLELLELVAQGERSVEVLAEGVGLPGAVNVPLRRLTRWLGRQDKTAEMVPTAGVRTASCRSKLLRACARGFTAHRLEDGFPEWKAAG